MNDNFGVLYSIKPEYCELIASGKKTFDVRKTIPKKLNPPFKCYIYCTKDKPILGRGIWHNGNRTVKDLTICEEYDFDIYNKNSLFRANGKVIGEFVVDEILDYEAEFVDDACQNSIRKFKIDEEDNERTYSFETSNEVDNPDDCKLCENSCMSFNEIKQYISKGKEGFFDFYALHISDLVIYDEPKELNEFYTECCPYLHNKTCYCNELCAYQEYNEHGDIRPCVKVVKRPPQSWCYIEGNII